MAEETKVSRKKHKKKSKFWFGYRIYVGVLVFLIVVMCFAVWNTMKKYEAAQPDKVVEKIIAKFEKGDISDVKAISKGNKFEADADLSEQFRELVKGKELTYKHSSGSYDSLAPEYDIMSGNELVAKISLKSVKEYKKMAILVLSDWAIEKVEPGVKVGNYQINITAPADYKVAINGVELGKEEQVGEATTMDGFTYVSEYVDAPKTVNYEVAGLMNIPELTVNGNVVSSDKINNNEGKMEYTVDFEPQEIDAELSAYVLNAAKTYSNYFSKDLDGCSVSVAPIAHLFPENSYYLEMAEIYRTQDMWMYSAHHDTTFRNEQVLNYTVYNDKCFSVNVIFEKSMILNLNGEERIEKNDQIYYYVNIDGRWVIADMNENIQ